MGGSLEGQELRITGQPKTEEEVVQEYRERGQVSGWWRWGNWIGAHVLTPATIPYTQANRERKKPKTEGGEIVAAIDVSSSKMAGAVTEGLAKLAAARKEETDLRKAEAAGTWFLKLVNKEVTWAMLPAPIKALFDNKNPLEAGEEED